MRDFCERDEDVKSAIIARRGRSPSHLIEVLQSESQLRTWRGVHLLILVRCVVLVLTVRTVTATVRPTSDCDTPTRDTPRITSGPPPHTNLTRCAHKSSSSGGRANAQRERRALARTSCVLYLQLIVA